MLASSGQVFIIQWVMFLLMYVFIACYQDNKILNIENKKYLVGCLMKNMEKSLFHEILF